MKSTADGESNREQLVVRWGERSANATLLRTARRVLKVDVKPTGALWIHAPADADVNAIEARVGRKGAWIFGEIDRVAGYAVSTPQRRYVSGETHLLQYRLAVEMSEDARVAVNGGRLVVFARRCDDQAHCRRLLRAFYALTARQVFRECLDAVKSPFLRRGMKSPPIVVRALKKRWGSYTPGGRIVLNVDLVRARPGLIDYVICHELTHAFFPNHSEEWKALLRSVLPNWETLKWSWNKRCARPLCASNRCVGFEGGRAQRGQALCWVKRSARFWNACQACSTTPEQRTVADLSWKIKKYPEIPLGMVGADFIRLFWLPGQVMTAARRKLELDFNL